MNRKSILILLVFLPAQFVLSQEPENDTLNGYTSYDSLIKLQSKMNDFEIFRELNYMKMNLKVNNDPNTVWMWTKLSIAAYESSEGYAGESPGSMLEPLHQQFLENSRLNPIRYVLGMAQTAAVGYLAYRHIKKYGFFK